MSYFKPINRPAGYAPFNAQPRVATIHSLQNNPSPPPPPKVKEKFKLTLDSATFRRWGIQLLTFAKSMAFLKFLVWLFVWWIFIKLEFGAVFFVLSGFIFMYLNLGTRKLGEDSAYHVFNRGFKELPGTLTAQHIEDQLTHKIRYD